MIYQRQDRDSCRMIRGCLAFEKESWVCMSGRVLGAAEVVRLAGRRTEGE